MIDYIWYIHLVAGVIRGMNMIVSNTGKVGDECAKEP